MISRYCIDLDEWSKLYQWITELLDIDRDLERKRVLMISQYLSMHGYEPHIDFSPLRCRCALIYGPSPRLYEQVQETKHLLLKSIPVFVVDGAAKLFIEMDIPFQVLVTDLDGGLENVYRCIDSGCIPFIHVHGDNIDLVLKLIESLSIEELNRCIFTHQLPEEIPLMVGARSFTDGDRAIAVAYMLGIDSVVLIAMGFGSLIGKYSKPWFSRNWYPIWNRKKLKFIIAKEIIARLHRCMNIYQLDPDIADERVGIVIHSDLVEVVCK